ncbi:MAG: HD domain-containing protein [Actinobacteria bacterium]|jgi:HD-GYP domain-containing protein (c-di-GMP phosphodiesterase class II)|nr:MAG: HD domain-containing protein [Actinomycetota bacterium]
MSRFRMSRKKDLETMGERPDVIAEEQRSQYVARAEKGRREVLYLAIVLILILGTGIVVYVFNFESLNGLFKSDYFNNMVRISLALLILAFIGYLAMREKSYSRQSQQIFNDLNNTTQDLQARLNDLTSLLEVSKLVAIADDLHARLENKMPHMKGHWKRVMFYAVETARKMELDDDYTRLIERAADLMDIGMLQVAGSLSQDAYKSREMLPADKEMIKRHTVIGTDMLAAIRPNWELIPLVRSHHEWWNGMGYPDGLKGESIPLGARILSVADSFAAMTSWRSYREILEPKDALKEIEAYSGVQYDPKVVLAFLAVMTPRVYGINESGREDAELILLKEINGSGAGMGMRKNPQIM